MTPDDLREAIARAMWTRNVAVCGDEYRLEPWASETEVLREDWREFAQAALDAIKAAGWTLTPPAVGIPMTGEQASRLWAAIKATAPQPETD